MIHDASREDVIPIATHTYPLFVFATCNACDTRYGVFTKGHISVMPDGKLRQNADASITALEKVISVQHNAGYPNSIFVCTGTQVSKGSPV